MNVAVQGGNFSSMPEAQALQFGQPSLPDAVQVMGRTPDKENGDICGDFRIQARDRLGHAVYQQKGCQTVIRYFAPLRRWLIDREGERDGEVCVAWAEDTASVGHPGHLDLIWHVWSANSQAHVRDDGVLALEGPAIVSVVGRVHSRAHATANGEYHVICSEFGRPVYQHHRGDLVIRFHQGEGRWMISERDQRGNVCSAFAEATFDKHPGNACLTWNFWEQQHNSFVPDPATRTLVAPSSLMVLGRGVAAGNSRINGKYHLAGVHEQRPLYIKPETQSIIRYQADKDRWLLDCDGLSQPSSVGSMFGRVASFVGQLVFSSDPAKASDSCTAFAEAQGMPHPGHLALEWNVWDSRLGLHEPDPCVRTTVAPPTVRLQGLAPALENGDINGEYNLIGLHQCRPAYSKPGREPGTQLAIVFNMDYGRWIVDRSGLKDLSAPAAWANAPPSSSDPSSTLGHWHIFGNARSLHLPDPKVTVTALADEASGFDLCSEPAAKRLRGPELREPVVAPGKENSVQWLVSGKDKAADCGGRGQLTAEVLGLHQRHLHANSSGF